MKRSLVILAFALAASVPAHAQSRGGGVGSSQNAGITFNGGGGAGGGINGGNSHLPTYTRAQFATAAFSGDGSFSPSGFLSFNQAVEAGKQATMPQESVAKAAADNVAASKAKSRVEFVQDDAGNLVPLPR